MKEINTGDTRGIRRKVDELGRIVIAKEFRESLEFKQNQKLEMFLMQDGIFIRKAD